MGDNNLKIEANGVGRWRGKGFWREFAAANGPLPPRWFWIGKLFPTENGLRISSGTLMEDNGKGLNGPGVRGAHLLIIRPLNGAIRLRNIICKSNKQSLISPWIRKAVALQNAFFCSNKVNNTFHQTACYEMLDLSRAWQTECVLLLGPSSKVLLKLTAWHTLRAQHWAEVLRFYCGFQIPHLTCIYIGHLYFQQFAQDKVVSAAIAAKMFVSTDFPPTILSEVTGNCP